MSQLYRHKKTGGVYEIISRIAKLQCSTALDFEKEFSGDWTVYKDIETGQIYIRPTEVFMDGRFEQLYSEQTGGAG